jgi:hypothetical protein
VRSKSIKRGIKALFGQAVVRQLSSALKTRSVLPRNLIYPRDPLAYNVMPNPKDPDIEIQISLCQDKTSIYCESVTSLNLMNESPQETFGKPDTCQHSRRLNSKLLNSAGSLRRGAAWIASSFSRSVLAIIANRLLSLHASRIFMHHH